MATQCDVVVIGLGPGGEATATQLAQAGLSVVAVDERLVGGECPYFGCIPSIAPRPVLLIWAPNGGNAETMNPEYHRLAGENALIWEMPDAQHIRGIVAQPEEYERRVIGFLDDALLGR